MRLTTRALAPLALLGCLLMPAGALATSTPQQIQAAKTAGVAHLRSLQESDGSFPGFESDWTLGALAAAGVPAAGLVPTGGSADARTYYRTLFGDPTTWPGGSEPSVTEFERATLDSYAAGIDPARVSVRQNLIAQVLARYQPANPGYYGGPSSFGGALFGLLALADAKTQRGGQRVAQSLLAESIAVVRANQHADGGWTFEKAEGNPTKLAQPAEPDETGAAMAALCSAGVPTSDPAITAAEHYLAGDEVEASGAFEAPFGVNTDSNAWGVQGLDACGVDPQGAAFTTAGGRTPIDFLLSQQVGDGGFRFEPGETESNEYSSQDALRAISGAGFTATPPKAKGQPRWVAASSFEAGVPSMLALVVETGGAGGPKACAVTVTPSGPTTTLAAVLEAAETSGKPAGCVTGFQPSAGKGAITQVDGSPGTPEARWEVSLDGGKEKSAKRGTKIALGDTIALSLH